MNNSNESRANYLQRKRINFFKNIKHDYNSHLNNYNFIEIGSYSQCSKSEKSKNFPSTSTQEDNSDKRSTCISSDETPLIPDPKSKPNTIFKYQQRIIKEEDLFPNEELFDFLIKEKKPASAPASLTGQLSLSNQSFNEAAGIANKPEKVEESVENSKKSKNATKIALKLRKIVMKNLKSKKIQAEPEDLEFLQLMKSKKAFVETIWNEQLFFEWEYKSEVNQKLSITDRSRMINFEKSNSECVICLHKFTKMVDMKLIRQCNHGFHKDCLNNWLRYNHICPIDKNKLE